jgi:hypothetical protein
MLKNAVRAWIFRCRCRVRRRFWRRPWRHRDFEAWRREKLRRQPHEAKLRNFPDPHGPVAAARAQQAPVLIE